MLRYLLLTVIILSLLVPTATLAASNGRVRMLVVDSAINPVTTQFVTAQINTANQMQEAAVLLQLDTPGGLDTAMRDIIQAQLNSSIPVIVFVAPRGARAASAGALITLAADFAAMAPGTNIGAAHPVAIGQGRQPEGTMQDKIENDAAAYARSLAQQRGRNADWAEKAVRESVSIAAREALELSVIDLIAESPESLLKELDGFKYLRNGEVRVFSGEGLELTLVEMNWRQQILNALSNPNIAYLLMMLGILGIFFEISQPGVILPGAVGAIALLLALFAFSSLPINYVGVLLILLAVVLFVLEIKVVSYGMLAVGGLVSMAFGSLILIDSSAPYLQISKAVIGATVSVSAGFILLAVAMVIRAQQRKPTSGREGMLGEIGTVVRAIEDGQGKVFVHGEYWLATAEEPLAVGTEVRIKAIGEGMKLNVTPVGSTPAQQHTSEEV